MKHRLLSSLLLIHSVLPHVYPEPETGKNLVKYNLLTDHAAVTDENVFPYVVAVLKKFSYLCSGALLDSKWVLTAADSLFLIRETSRVLRVRLGSINYKKGGVLVPVKAIEIHPYFDDSKPAFDVALLKLADDVRFSPNIYPISMQRKLQEVTATHFIVTAWTPSLRMTASQNREIIPSYALKQRRILSLSHLHPSKPGKCKEELAAMDIYDSRTTMCLDPDLKSDPCWRDTGAPVVLNGILWGIVSSWRPDNCHTEGSPSYVTLVAAKNVSSWIYSTTSGSSWNNTVDNTLSEEDYSDDL